jgi:hypothetical protein
MLSLVGITLVAVSAGPQLREPIEKFIEQQQEFHKNYKTLQKEEDSNFKSFDVGSFSAVNIQDSFSASISQGKEYSVIAYGSEENIKDVKVQKKGDTLVLKRNNHMCFLFLACKFKPVSFKITTPDLYALDISGASKVDSKDFDSKNLEIDLSGASYVDISNFNYQQVEADISGASQMYFDLTNFSI